MRKGSHEPSHPSAALPTRPHHPTMSSPTKDSREVDPASMPSPGKDKQQQQQQQLQHDTQILRTDLVARNVYDELIRSVYCDAVSNLHHLIKTGEIAASTLTEPVSRKSMYPDLYRSAQDAAKAAGPTTHRRRNDKVVDVADIDEHLAKYSTEVMIPPTRKRPPYGTPTAEDREREVPSADDNKRQRKGDSPRKSRYGSPTKGAGKSEVSSPALSTRQATSQTDIWGRIPPKELRTPCECRLCGRQISALRFAQHLDKCMGLSNSRPSSSSR